MFRLLQALLDLLLGHVRLFHLVLKVQVYFFLCLELLLVVIERELKQVQVLLESLRARYHVLFYQLNQVFLPELNFLHGLNQCTVVALQRIKLQARHNLSFHLVDQAVLDLDLLLFSFEDRLHVLIDRLGHVRVLDQSLLDVI